jgi:hypothetical protein
LGKLSVDIIEDTYLNKSAAAANNLSILIGMDRFAYLIHTADRQVLVLREYEQEPRASTTTKQGQSSFSLSELEQICKEDAHLSQSYARIRIGWTTPFSALVPKRLYDADHKAAYLQYLTHPEGQWDYVADELPNFEAVQVYAILGEGLSWCKKQFPGSEMLHASTAFLDGARTMLNGQPGGGRRLFIHISPGAVRLTLLNETHLYFTNSYTFQTAKDFLYYVLAVFDECELDQETTPILLSGQLIEDSEIYRLLYRYFRKLSFVPCPPQLSLGPQLSALPQHLYTDLYFLALHAG